MEESREELKELFCKFSNQFDNKSMITKDQSENLKQWYVRKKASGITISQVDNWLLASELCPKPFRQNYNGEVFFRFK